MILGEDVLILKGEYKGFTGHCSEIITKNTVKINIKSLETDILISKKSVVPILEAVRIVVAIQNFLKSRKEL